MDRTVDTLVALAFALFGAFVIWQASFIQMGVVRDPIGPRAAFYLCGGLMVGGGLWVVARNLRAWIAGDGRWMAEEGNPDEPLYTASFGRAALLIATCLAYAALLNPLGYLIATPIFLLAAQAIMGQRKWGLNILVALSFTVIAYIVFSQLLSVRMPHGPLTGPLRNLGWITL